MSTPSAPEDPTELLTPELLAAVHAARRLRSAVAENVASRGVTTAELWQHARRRPGEPVSFAVERAIRTDGDLAARYRIMLQGFATAHATMAIAASDGGMTKRRVGPYSFERIDDGGSPMLVIRMDQGAPAPEMVELILGERSFRFSPGQATNSAIILALDPSVPDSSLITDLLTDPATEIFVF
jgi:hypothetical protein